MIECPSPEEWVRLEDGELTENEARERRRHLAACPRCTARHAAARRLLDDIAAPAMRVDVDYNVRAVLARIEAEQRPYGGAPARWWLAAAGLAAAAGLVLASTLLVRHPPPPSQAAGAADGGYPEYAPRGHVGPPLLDREVGVKLYAVAPLPRALDHGAVVAASTGFTVGYRNLQREAAYLMVFAVDPRGTVHWLFPGYLDEQEDPVAVRLETAVDERLMPDSVVLEDVARGMLRVFVLVSHEPLRVSAIESLGRPELALGPLRRRFGAAVVREMDWVVE